MLFSPRKFTALAILIILFGVSPSFAGSFKSEIDGFSLQLPPGWIEIPASAIADAEREVAIQSPNAKPVHYDFGFQLGSPGQWFTYPYVLVQVKRLGRVPETEFAKLPQLATATVESKFQAEHPTMASGIEIGKPQYDPVSKRVWMNLGMSVTTVGRISGSSVVIPVEYGFLQFNGYSRERESLGFLTVFQEIISSISISDEVKYKSRLSDRFPILSSISWEKTIGWALSGAILGGFGVFLRRRK